MFCGKCGTKINEGDSFCTNCGEKIVVNISSKIDTNLLSNNKNTDLVTQINKSKLISEYKRNTTIDEIDTIKFGSYPQSDTSGVKKEPIEWIVLEKDNDKVFLMSKYILDCKKMFMNYEKGSDQNFWAMSDLRGWLNGRFMDIAFTDEEKDKIILSNVFTHKDNHSYGVAITITDEYTHDYIYLLTEKEVCKYFDFEYSDSIVKKYSTIPTKYAIAQGFEDNYYSRKGVYWLRDNNGVNCYDDYKFFVSGREGLGNSGQEKSDAEHIGIRPVLWVKVE